MIEYKTIAGYLSIIVAVIAYIPYFRGIILGKIKPHAFSWLVWFSLVGITFAAQVVKHGGAGSWVTGLTAVTCFAIFLFALVKGERRFVLFDWLSLMAAFVALIFWLITNDPTLSIILVTIIDGFGLLPMLRKGYLKPYEDSPFVWLLTAAKWSLAIYALDSYSLATLLYPTYLIITNVLYALLLILRRKAVS